MGINFSIVSLLNSKDKINATSLEYVISESEVPTLHLKHVNYVGGGLYSGVHQIPHLLHLKLPIPILLHKPLLRHHIQIKELLLCCIFLETLRNPLVPITHQKHNEVFLLEIQILIDPQFVVVVDHTCQGVF